MIEVFNFDFECMPDYDAYAMKERDNPSPEDMFGSSPTFVRCYRTTGGKEGASFLTQCIHAKYSFSVQDVPDWLPILIH
jgi:hypothetical protein